MSNTVNVLIVGVGGQGVLRTSQVLADVLMRQGHDVKQSEVHGMSQRGGSVVSEVRYGDTVYSPLTPEQAADFIIALNDDEGRRAEPRLRPGSGRLITTPRALVDQLDDIRGKNMAALGRLSSHLDISSETWHDAIRHHMPPKSVESNIAAFDAGARFEEDS